MIELKSKTMGKRSSAPALNDVKYLMPTVWPVPADKQYGKRVIHEGEDSNESGGSCLKE